MDEYIKVYLFHKDEKDSEEELILSQIYTEIAWLYDSLEEDDDTLDEETIESLEKELFELEEKVRLLKFIPLENDRQESPPPEVIQEARPLHEVYASPTSKKTPEEAEKLLSEIGVDIAWLHGSLEEDRP